MTNPSRPGLSRRQFLRNTGIAAVVASMPGCAVTRSRALSGKINLAIIGVGGKGTSDTDLCANAGENIVALCDVDEGTDDFKKQRPKYPNAKFYRDYRRMLEEMDSSIDAVIVSTPDHLHAVVAAQAMEMGKHVYCQKPLTQTVYEARYLRDLARRRGLVTQMGNQGSAEDGLRRAVEVVQAGVLGNVRQVYVWSNRPIWPQGMDRPAGSDPVPTTLDWDLWLGPAKDRPYKRGVYQPFAWRGWQDFGTGALGDMACHTANMPFRALKLGYPTEIEAESSGINQESYPLASKIRFEFPSREGLVPTTFWWYDGGKPSRNSPTRHDGSNKPPKEVTADVEALMSEVPGSGCLLIGDKGKLFSPDDYGAQFYLKLQGMSGFVPAKDRQSKAEHEAIRNIPVTIPRNAPPGEDADTHQHLEWLKAMHEGKPELCYSRFDIAAYLTEIILLGCVALRSGKKLEWDGPNMRAKNAPEAAAFIKPQMRSGWKL
jgi:hypothetical protein